MAQKITALKLSNRAQNVLRGHFSPGLDGEVPVSAKSTLVWAKTLTPADARAAFRDFSYLCRLKGCGRQTAYEIAKWARIAIPPDVRMHRCPTCGCLRQQYKKRKPGR